MVLLQVQMRWVIRFLIDKTVLKCMAELERRSSLRLQERVFIFEGKLVIDSWLCSSGLGAVCGWER